MTVSRVETLVDNQADLAYPTTESGSLSRNSLEMRSCSLPQVSPTRHVRTDKPGPQHSDVLIHELPLR